MTGSTTLLRLMSWLSPVFPIGGFAYSAGLEQAVHAGHVGDRASLEDWIAVQITQGTLWNDAVIVVEAHRSTGDDPALSELSRLCLALCVGQERLNETINQGTSFIAAVSHWVERSMMPGRDTPLPVAVGAAAGHERIDPRLTVSAYLHAFVSNQLQCAIRLSVVGQEGAAKALAGLEPVIERTAGRAATATLDDLGGAAFIADTASMNHEFLEPRLFLS
ncbi:urease accessory protein UreF [Hoeflea sp. IMCC20628]|uniref:urease accessory protein UreF n=1 Tax=Hoeflea sp. IMCC20628 TaxID=1620421 RepID=UPI00063AAAE9|nr:urease accessory protein UreF [Hoeflea sp. IMCC20628]AKI01587.1 urease accessory protein UreF [Hoeflea sp. IMCC20628]